ncbi:hypothetical protein [Streptobacillus canis]|uniref:hypothetical protein n=1 Tax=Streptobacillus canis TaxID=2678686 RepID=UPI0012E14A18|nr:hypothetical protein [Streptobacillus canis]
MYLEKFKSGNKIYLYKTTSISNNEKIRIPLGELNKLKEKLKDVTDDPIKYFENLFKEERDANSFEEITTTFINRPIFDNLIDNIDSYSDESKNLGCIFL